MPKIAILQDPQRENKVAKSRIGDKAGILSNFGIQTVPDRNLCPQKPAAAVDRPMETHTWDSEKNAFLLIKPQRKTLRNRETTALDRTKETSKHRS
jgi:hypothetical protein